MNNQASKLYIGLFALLVIVSLQCLYAVQLNAVYYSLNLPFFDSASYNQQLANLIVVVHERGLLDGLKITIFGGSPTTVLPFLIVAFAGIFFEPSRAIGVWEQGIWVWALAASVFFYFQKFFIKSVPLAIALTLPFIGLSAIWHYNGGLSDFRMDLHLYLLLGITFTWYLITYKTEKLYPWIVCGIAMGLTCLARTLAPVHLVFTLTPLLLIRLIWPQKAFPRSLIIRNTLLMTALGALVCGWYYIINLERIYYYYIVWNTDANASLDWLISSNHAWFAIRSIGWFPFVLAAFLLPFTLSGFFKNKSFIPASFLKEVDWKILWLGIAPTLFLVIRGAGLNPFVSMPSAFGIILFLLKPFNEFWSLTNTTPKSFRATSILASSIASILFLAIAISSISNHIYPREALLRGGALPSKLILDAILTDARNQGKLFPTYSVASLGFVNDRSLLNTFIFDYNYLPKFQLSANPSKTHDFTTFRPTYIFESAAVADWEELPGETNTQKIAYMVKQTNRQSDYTVIPEVDMLSSIKNTTTSVVVNRFVSKIRDRLLKSDNWIPVSNIININDYGSVRVYRNRRRVP